jgi:general secretion pathway protein A
MPDGFSIARLLMSAFDCDAYLELFRRFGLDENPFKMSTDLACLTSNQRAQRTLNELANGIRAGKGLLVLTGEVGTGKTMLVKRLIQWLELNQVPTAFIFNPRLEPSELFEWVLESYKVSADSHVRGNAKQRLNQWLCEQHRVGVSPVLVIDEAQGLSSQAFEEVRLLLNHEACDGKLIQIVLSGQPELDDMLKRPEMRTVRQRIEVRCRTATLDREEAYRYIQMRLDAAGAAGRSMFLPEAIDAIHTYSQGIPRLTNLLCERTLLLAGSRELGAVPPEIVATAVRDLELDEINPVVGPMKESGIEWRSLDEIPLRVNKLGGAEAPAPNTEEAIFPANAKIKEDPLLRPRPDASGPAMNTEAASFGKYERHNKTGKAQVWRTTLPMEPSLRSNEHTLFRPPDATQSLFGPALRAVRKMKVKWNELSPSLRSPFDKLSKGINFCEQRKKLRERAAAVIEWMNQPMPVAGTRRRRSAKPAKGPITGLSRP